MRPFAKNDAAAHTMLRASGDMLLAHEPGEAARLAIKAASYMVPPEPPSTNGDACCAMRRKVVLVPVSVPETTCGVPDSAVADFVRFDMKAPNGQAVVSFRFCPWCGVPWRTTGAIVQTGATPGQATAGAAGGPTT